MVNIFKLNECILIFQKQAQQNQDMSLSNSSAVSTAAEETRHSMLALPAGGVSSGTALWEIEIGVRVILCVGWSEGVIPRQGLAELQEALQTWTSGKMNDTPVCTVLDVSQDGRAVVSFEPVPGAVGLFE